MADKKIGELPSAPDIYNDTLIPVESQGFAKHITGAQWKEYAQAAVAPQVASASQDAAKAAESAKAAQQYSGNPPIIQNETWWTWDAKTQAYVDTGKTARGDPGPPGPVSVEMLESVIAAHNEDRAAHEVRRLVISERERDSEKPDYGVGGLGGG